MEIFDKLKKLVFELEPFRGKWAICGGVAACLYRDVPRFTGDIDVVLGGLTIAEAQDAAETVLRRLGYEPKLGFITDLHGALLKGPALILAREPQTKPFVGIDFLLPVQAWADPAVRRAQHNPINYGFASLPTITPEDLIIAKLFALHSSPGRPYDLDDVLSILSHMKEIDLGYVAQAVKQYALRIPAELSEKIKIS